MGLAQPTLPWTNSGLNSCCGVEKAPATSCAAACASRFEAPTRKVVKVSLGSSGEPSNPP
jgi:hypothetical protein